jgi:hypothetical protein
VLEQAIASAVPRIVIEKPIVATLPQIEKLNALLANPTLLPACWRSITGWRASKR